MVDSESGDIIDDHASHIEHFEGLEGLIQVSCENPGLKSVDRVVDSLQCLFKVFVGIDHDDRRKGFEPGDAELGLDVFQDRGLEHRTVPFSSGDDACALFNCFADPFFCLFCCTEVDHRADIGVFFQWISYFELLGGLYEIIHEPVINFLMKKNPLDRYADLSGVRIGTQDRPGDGKVQVGIRFDNDCRVSPEFKCDFLFVSLFFKLPADFRTPREGEHFDSLVAQKDLGRFVP